MFEYDPVKSADNLAKHGIDFEMAKELWDDPKGIELVTAYLPEQRSILVGAFREKLWAVVFTERPPNIRIISARRARPKETEAYVSQANQR